MREKIKKFLKSKTGNMALMAIILVPTVLLIFSSTVATNRRRNVQKSEVLVSIDSFCDYVNEAYGKILKINGVDVCGYSSINQEKMTEYFNSYFVNIDGYVQDKWSCELNFDTDSIGNTSFTATCNVYFPKISSSMSTVNYWGRYLSGGANGDGWYSNHSATMSAIFDKSEDKKSNDYWIYEKIEVTSSCV